MSQFNQFIQGIAQNPLVRGATQFVQNLPQELLRTQEMPGKIAQDIAPNAPITPLLQGNLPQTGKNIVQEAQNVGLAKLPGETPAQQANRLATHFNFAGEVQEVPGAFPKGTILDAQGNPVYKQPTELGSYKMTPQGTLEKNMEPQQPVMAPNTEEMYKTEPPIGKTPEQLDQSQWPEEPQSVLSARMKKPLQFPGTHDPISEIQASNASKNSRAFSVTTPDIQDAYRRNNITDPSQVNNVKQSLYTNTINPALEKSTTRLPLGDIGKVDGILPRIIQEMQDMDPSLDEVSARNAALPLFNRINKIAQSESGAPVPSDISLKGVMDYKTNLNHSNAVSNYMDGQLPQTPQDIATVSTRNVLSGLLDKYAPKEITQAIKDYGLLEEGFPSYLKAVTKERKPFSVTESTLGEIGKYVPGQPLIDVGARTLGKIASSPVGKLGLAGATGSGLTLAGMNYLPGLYNNLTKGNATEAKQNPSEVTTQIHDTSIAPGVKNGLQSQQGRYSFQQPQQSGFLTTNDYTKKVNDINSRLPQEKLNNPQAAAQDQSTLDQLNTSWQNQQPIRDAGTKLNTTMGVANMAIPLIQKAPLNLLNLNGSYNNLLNSTNKDYQALGTLLQSLQKQTGINFAQATSGDQLISMLDNAMKIMQNDYNGQVQQFFGGNTLNAGGSTTGNITAPPAVQPTPTGLPSIGTPVHYNFNFGQAGQGLPAIQ